MKFFSLFFCLLALLIACDTNTTEPNYNDYYASLNYLSPVEIIKLTNEWKYSAPKITSHITQNEIIIDFPNNVKFTKALPQDSFYMAIAPYINTTHTCELHYPSSCDAELKEQNFTVIAKDDAGNTIINKEIKSLKNGFIELWLPRNININMKIQYQNKTGEEKLSTMPTSRTCITTIKLQ